MNCSLSCEEAFESHPVPFISSQHYFLKDLSPFQNVLAWTYHLKLFVCFLWVVWKVKILSEVLLFVYGKTTDSCTLIFFCFIGMIVYQCFLVKSWDPLSVGHIIWKVWWLNFFVFFLHPLYSPSHPAAVRTTSTICLRGAGLRHFPLEQVWSPGTQVVTGKNQLCGSHPQHSACMLTPTLPSYLPHTIDPSMQLKIVGSMNRSPEKPGMLRLRGFPFKGKDI